MTGTISNPEKRLWRTGALFPRQLSYVHVFLVGLVLRLLYLWQASRNNEILDYPIVDASVYVGWAQSILSGHVLWSEPINYTPMYPFYLAFWFFFFGNATRFVFLLFHVLGAIQAVMLGKAAEAVWDRKTGLLAGFIAALYWPFVIIEASFFCESFALWTLSLGLFFLGRYAHDARTRDLFVSGSFIGIAGLCRANMLLCLPVLACWLAWDAARAGIRNAAPGSAAVLRGLRLAVVFLLPVIILSAPISLWNYHRVGSPILRTQAGACLYLGNNPDFDGLIVPPGIEWNNLSNEPLRAGQTLLHDRERFWVGKTIGIIRHRTRDWLVLQARKLSMHLGAFEISQEIDIYRFRRFSSALNLPVWPGFGFVASLALAGMALAIRRRQRTAAPLGLFAAAYFLSIFPFQVASRFRLPLALVAIPFAAYAIVSLVQPSVFRNKRRLAISLLGVAALYAVVAPDYTHVRGRNTIRYEYFVGEKRFHHGDLPGALQALSESAAKYPADADSLLLAGDIHFARGDTGQASACFQEAEKRQPRNAPALMGMARCAIMQKQFDKAESLLQRCLTDWPNSMQALVLLNNVYFVKGDWRMAEKTLMQMHTYVSCPVKMTFRLALVYERLGEIEQAVAVYDKIAGDSFQDRPDRARAAFSAATLLWRHGKNPGGALKRWKDLAAGPACFFTPLAARLAGECDDRTLLAGYNNETRKQGEQYIAYTMGLAAWMRGDIAAARSRFEEVLATRQARNLKQWRLSAPEYWAISDLARLDKLSRQTPPR